MARRVRKMGSTQRKTTKKKRRWRIRRSARRGEKPLGKGTGRARLMPIPEEESDGESRMRVRPGGIEIHVDGKRAGPPDGDGGEERAAFADVLAGETEGEQQTQKTVDGGGERHSDAVGSGEPG